METRRENEEVEIDLLELIKVLWSKALWIAAAAAVIGALAFGVTFAKNRSAVPAYEAGISIYIDYPYNDISSSTTNVSVTTDKSDGIDSITASGIFVLQSRSTMEAVIERAQLPYSVSALHGMISSETVKDAPAFTVKVKCANADEAVLIADTIAAVLPGKIAEVMNGSIVTAVDSHSEAALSVASAGYVKNSVLGVLIGLFVGAAVIAVKYVIDKQTNDTVRSAAELRRLYPELPILTLVPAADKGVCSYTSYYNGRENKDNA